jgi:hypothetical protein
MVGDESPEILQNRAGVTTLKLGKQMGLSKPGVLKKIGPVVEARDETVILLEFR